MSIYVVTGGAGFIGSHIVEALIARGDTVRILDNLSTSRRERVHPQAEFFHVDFRDLEAIRPVFEGADGVFHTGALPRIPLSIEQPIETTNVNIMGTLNVLVAARDAKVKRVVYSASSSAYGRQTKLPLTTDMPAHPLNPYALQKYVGEIFCRQFSELYGLETVSLRYFNVYGPRMAEEGAYVNLIAAFRVQRRLGNPLPVYGDGEQTRDFTHVSDVVRANLLAMASEKVGQGQVLNVGGGEQHSVNKIAQAFNHPIAYHPPRPGEPRDTKADTSQTKDLIDWEPLVKFQDGLQDLLGEE